MITTTKQDLRNKKTDEIVYKQEINMATTKQDGLEPSETITDILLGTNRNLADSYELLCNIGDKLLTMYEKTQGDCNGAEEEVMRPLSVVREAIDAREWSRKIVDFLDYMNRMI